MSTALIFGNSGSGKTVNSTLVKAPNRGKNLLICTDNSSIVLNNFERPNLDVVNTYTIEEMLKAFDEACASGKYDNVILDNLSDVIDLYILELEEAKVSKDARQHYSICYSMIKRLVRNATAVRCNVVFTAWCDVAEVTQPDGSRINRQQPKIRQKILDNVLGLMNVVAYVTTADDKGAKRWYYVLEGTPTLLVKDQIACRKSCLPENIFNN